jgi:hypothetical protein
MGVIATFDYDTDPVRSWLAQYPEFTAPTGAIPVTEAQANVYFFQATQVHANDGSGPVCDVIQQQNLLNMATAHIAAIFAPPNGQAAASTLVGRISDASEGSVSVSAQNDYPPGSSQWWQQTKYGSMYYLATKQFRRMRYYPNPRSPVQRGWGNGGYGGWGSGGSGWIG